MRAHWWLGFAFALTLAGCAGGSGAGNGDGNGNGGESGTGGGNELDGGSAGTSGNGIGDGGDGPKLRDAATTGIPGCKPKTCEDLKTDCGPVADGCGGVVECGDCAKGELCGIVEHNVCTKPADLCKAESKADACKGKQCGFTGDGCGGMIDCGDCSGSDVCGLNAPYQCDAPPPATPNDCPAKITSCASVGAQCGMLGNGCGGLIDCDVELGGCGNGQACGITAPEQCGTLPVCTPLDMATACAGTCGIVSNGCAPTQSDDGLIDCDSDPLYQCPQGETCGAGGVAGKCGDPSMGTCTPVSKQTACGSALCGVASDGCNGMFTCGMCDTDEICTSGQCNAICTPTLKATACNGKECGLVSDGCNGSYDCGTCTNNETCGAKAAYQCDAPPPPQCVPLTKAVACAGKECGMVFDGCGTAAGNQIQCGILNGTCAGNEFCGIKTPFQCDPPTPPMCTAAGSCAALGWACGIAIDSCGNQYDCSTEGRSCDPQTETCIGGITGPTTCQTGSGGPGGGTCTVCAGIPDCSGQTQVTKLKGRVITPGASYGDTANQVGVPNAFVYILTKNDETTLPAISSGIPKDGNGAWTTACDRCDDQNLGSVLTSATTDAKGEFTLVGDIPLATEFVLVVKIGKWRRAQKVTIAKNSTTECKDNTIDKEFTRLPRNRTDGLAVNIPRIAISTGQVDAMECVFKKMGLDTGEFAQPGASGAAAQRVHMYASEDARGAVMASGANGYTGDSALYNNETRLFSYDMVVFDCEGNAYNHNASDPNIRKYVNRGGRMFASHWSYTWVYDNAGVNYASNTFDDTRMDTSATWGSGSVASATGYVSVNRTNANTQKIPTFSSWLLNEGAVTQSGADYTFTITDPRDLASSVNTGSEEWVYRFTTNPVAPSCGTCSGQSQAVCQANPKCSWSNGGGGNCNTVSACSTFNNNQSGCLAQTGCSWSTTVILPFGTCSQSPACSTHSASESTCKANNGCAWVGGSAGVTSVQQYSFNTPFGAPSTDICGRVAYSGFHVAGSGTFTDQVFPAHCTGNLTAQEKVLLFMLFDLAGCVTTGGPPSPPDCSGLGQSDCTGKCGSMADGCGGTLSCGNCPSGQICSANNTCQPANCQQTSCQAQGATCGTIADGCGGTLTCPVCPSGQVCGLYTPNQCATTCTPSNMQTACSGKCGFVSDGCGGVHACGGCTGNQVCLNNMCTTGMCTPLNACPQGLECGVISDGCSGTVNCGMCTLPDVCGGGGQANVCGQPMCNPLDCSDLNADCGWIGDGCGGSKDCGACGPGQVCGIAGPNKCGGCQPLECDDVGAECGKIGDGCGGSKDCGVCTGGKICGATSPNKCGVGQQCDPLGCDDVDAECGLIGDGCGGVVDCGKCISTQVCGIKSPNKCNAPPTCNPQTCTDVNAECGSIGDGCGGLLNCGACLANQQCGVLVPNQCSGVE